MALKDICPIIFFKNLVDESGKLVVVEGGQNIPFDIKRVFYIYGSDSSVVRGQHANKNSEFILINVAGKSKVKINDGKENYIVELDKPMMGVYIPRLIWKEMYDFSSDSVLLVLASTHYDGQEYIRDYPKYLELICNSEEAPFFPLTKQHTISSKNSENNDSFFSPVLSLCMPTNGVIDWVFPSLESIYDQQVDENLFEVVIMDNGNNTDFVNKIREYQKKHPNLKYFSTDKPLFLSEPESYRAAKGELIKFVNHRFLLREGAIEYFLKFVKKYRESKPVIYFSNGGTSIKNAVCSYRSFGEFVCALEYYSTWSGGMTVWKSDFDKMRNFLDYNYLFPHTDILFQKKFVDEYIIDGTHLWDEMPQENKPKGNYNVFFAFSVEFMFIILNLLRDNHISLPQFLKVKKDILNFITELYLLYIVRKRYCCYDLTLYKESIRVFFSIKDIWLTLGKVCFKKLVRKIKRIKLFSKEKNC